jgi:hypothetical protein
VTTECHEQPEFIGHSLPYNIGVNLSVKVKVPSILKLGIEPRRREDRDTKGAGWGVGRGSASNPPYVWMLSPLLPFLFLFLFFPFPGPLPASPLFKRVQMRNPRKNF